MPVSFTRKGWIEVWQGETWISRHSQEREAIEKVVNLILQADHEVEYEIRGVTIVAKGYGVLSPGGGDTQAPTTPGSLTATGTSATTVRLTWTQSTDNVGVTGYQVFRNGTPIGTTTALQYDDTGRSPSTQYSYTVTAYDAAGNNSTAAGPALVTTDANSAPVWSLGNQSYDNGDAVNISLDGVCSDADGDTITYSLVSGSLPTGLALSGARNQTLSGTVTADGSYAFVLGASDGIASVQNVSLTFTVSTPDTTAPNAPSAPTIVDATSSTITLSLPTSGASDHASYTIQRSTDGVSYGTRASGITASSWQDTGLSAGTTYYYRLLDVDTSGNVSTAGPADSGQTDAAPSGTNGARISAILAGRSPHFAYNTPADPVITREETVTTATAFNAAAATSGTRIIVNTSFAGDVRIRANDIDVVMSNSATITGNLNIGDNGIVSRVRWTGGNLMGNIWAWRHHDLLIDDFYALTTGSGSEDNHGFGKGAYDQATFFRRLAILNSTLQVRKSSSTDGTSWALYTPQNTSPLTSSLRHEDFFFLNSKTICRGLHGHRIMSIRRAVYCDAVFSPDGESGSGIAGSCLRIHLGTDYVWIKDSWGRGNMPVGHVSTAGEGPHVQNAIFDNFDRYEQDDNYMFADQMGGYSNSGTVINSTLYTTAGASGSIGISGGVTIGSGCTRAAWDGVTVPDHSTVGAIR
jgi:chitodextrinase